MTRSPPVTTTSVNQPAYFQPPQPTMSPAISSPTPTESSSTATLPIRKHKFPLPLLRLEFRDLADDGTSVFLTHVHGHEDLSTQVQNVLNLLYRVDDAEKAPRPGTRSVTFIVREFEGVAYTTGRDLDDDHKEIHINTKYIRTRNGDVRHELLGVICHELVHCFQWNARGTCPGGFIEGIADWVRLNAGLGAKHWRQEADGEWDGGYQHTGYFLDWLEQKFGDGTVCKLNACLREGQYKDEKVFGKCCNGTSVKDLWELYKEEFEEKKKAQEGEKKEEGPANPVPTHPVKSGCGCESCGRKL